MPRTVELSHLRLCGFDLDSNPRLLGSRFGHRVLTISRPILKRSKRAKMDSKREKMDSKREKMESKRAKMGSK